MKDTASRFARDNKISTGRSARRWLCSTFLVVLADAMPSIVHAEEWTGAVSTNWNTAPNRQGGAVPAGSDVHTDNEGAGWPGITGDTHNIGRIWVGQENPGADLTIRNGGTLNISDTGLVTSQDGYPLEHFPDSLNRKNSLSCCLVAFSSREVVSTSLENALGSMRRGNSMTDRPRPAERLQDMICHEARGR